MDPERLAFRHAPDATLILADRVILRASLAVEPVFGWTPKELEGQSIRLLYPGPTDYEVIGDRARKAMQGAKVYRDERFMRKKDGQVVWMEGRGTALDRDDPQKLAVWTYRPLEPTDRAGDTLTPAEKRIARYLVNGFTSKEIAQAVGASPRTVEVHRARVFEKMDVKSAVELANSLREAGWAG